MPDENAKEIIFIGDSLMEIFDWEARFPRHKVKNLGASGETVEQLLQRLPNIISSSPRADKIFVMIGINNLTMEDTGFIGRYRELLNQLQTAYPNARVYVNSILPTLLPWVTPKIISDINASLRAVADETNALYLNIHKAFIEGNLKKLLSPDGVHLSEKGYEVWSNILEGIIKG